MPRHAVIGSILVAGCAVVGACGIGPGPVPATPVTTGSTTPPATRPSVEPASAVPATDEAPTEPPSDATGDRPDPATFLQVCMPIRRRGGEPPVPCSDA